MKISFVQLYSEVGASFDRIDGPLLHALVVRLNGLEKNIPELAKKFQGGDFKLLFTLSAKSGVAAVDIKGPTVWKKENKVGFSLFLPWRKTNDFIDEVEFVLPWISKAIVSVFHKYDVDGSGVDLVIREVIEETKASPDKFRYANRSTQ